MIGPAVAGLVIAQTGTGWAFVLNGLSFGAVLLTIYLLRTAELRVSAIASRGSGGFIEGLRYVWARPDLRSILLMPFLIGTFGLNFPIFISTMEISVLHADALGFGLLSSIMAVGTMGGALVANGRDRPQFGSLLFGVGMLGIGCMLAAFSPGYWWFAAALAVIEVAAPTFTTSTNSMMQLSTIPTMRGRVMAAKRQPKLYRCGSRLNAHLKLAGLIERVGRARNESMPGTLRLRSYSGTTRTGVAALEPFFARKPVSFLRVNHLHRPSAH